MGVKCINKHISKLDTLLFLFLLISPLALVMLYVYNAILFASYVLLFVVVFIFANGRTITIDSVVGYRKVIFTTEDGILYVDKKKHEVYGTEVTLNLLESYEKLKTAKEAAYE